MTTIRLATRPENFEKMEKIIFDSFEIAKSSEYLKWEDGQIVRYYNVLDSDQKDPLQDHHVITFCRTWRSKFDVMQHFNITFEQASEILIRLEASGDLDCELERKRYIFRDSKVRIFNEECWVYNASTKKPLDPEDHRLMFELFGGLRAGNFKGCIDEDDPEDCRKRLDLSVERGTLELGDNGIYYPGVKPENPFEEETINFIPKEAQA